MTTPTSGTIGIGNLQTEFGYGNNLYAYRRMYAAPQGGPITLSSMYNKSNTKRFSSNIAMAGDYVNSQPVQYAYSISQPGCDGCPWDVSISVDTGSFYGIAWVKNAIGYTDSVILTLTNVNNSGFHPPSDYFNALHLPSVFWADRVNAAYYQVGNFQTRWVWGGYASNPFGILYSGLALLER